ncbi:MAG TPA: hypothetical protein VKX29_05135 [Brumimicrobium sp.]|nr:hypothetical protein [Brumimicrobium sp.]
MRILSYILFFWTFGSYAQEHSLQFKFVDVMTNSNIDSVELSLPLTSDQIIVKQWVQNEEVVDVYIPKSQMLRVTAKKEGFYSLDTLINLNSYHRGIKKGSVIPITLNFHYDGQYSNAFDIRANYKPVVAFASERISVSDYVIIDEETMILLAYPKRLNSSSELILYVNDSIILRRNVPEKAIRLDTDYRNRVYLRCEFSDYLIENSLSLKLIKVPREQLNNFIQPILDTLENDQLFFTTYKSHYPAFDFFNVNMKDTTNELLHHIEDSEMMEHYLAEYKWADVRTKLWAWDMEAETGIDREVWVGANVFTNSIYYEAPYSELFLIDETVYVFDFYKDLLFLYDAFSGASIDSITIDFHKDAVKTGWERIMYQDPITKKIYTSYDDSGYSVVYEINTLDGQKQDKFTLYYRYVENIQIHNDEVYYVYRPFESLQKKYLYKEGFMDTNRSLAGQGRFNQIVR